MNDLISLDIYYLVYYFVAIFAASFAVPSGAMIVIVSFASAASGWSDILLLTSLSLIATISGDYSAYLLAHYLRGGLDKFLHRNQWIKEKMSKVDLVFKRYGSYTVFLTRFLFTAIGPYVNYFSGLRGLPQWTFLKAVIAGETLYSIIFISIGYYFRESWQETIVVAKDYLAFAVFTILGLVIIYRVTIKIKKTR